MRHLYILHIIYYIFIIIELTLSLIPPTFSINYLHKHINNENKPIQ